MVAAFSSTSNVGWKVESGWERNSLLEKRPTMLLPSFNPEGISSPKL